MKKTRLGLIPADVLEEIGKVYTKGAFKYSIFEDATGNQILGKDITFEESLNLKLVDDGADNWKKGLSLSSMVDSAERHISAFKQGQDIDELGTHTLSNAVWNLMTIIWYQKHLPELDDRDVWWKKPFKKVWIDIDGILASFEQHFLEYLNLPLHAPTDWNDPRFRKNFDKIATDDTFWISCPTLIKPEDITYPIDGYCTTRPCNYYIIECWLELNGFPTAAIINTEKGVKKSDVLKGICDIMVDDSIYNFVDLNSNGITCYLMTRPHNIKYNVGLRRVNNIGEFMKILMV